MDVRPVVVEGQYVKLEPLTCQHDDAFFEAARDFSVSRWNTAASRSDRVGSPSHGAFRSYIVRPDGQVHDAVFYSIIDSEWPAVRSRLGEMLARR